MSSLNDPDVHTANCTTITEHHEHVQDTFPKKQLEYQGPGVSQGKKDTINTTHDEPGQDHSTFSSIPIHVTCQQKNMKNQPLVCTPCAKFLYNGSEPKPRRPDRLR
jgi:hypothetical protein